MKKTKSRKKTKSAKKTADLLRQLKKAGATVTVLKDGKTPKTLTALKKKSRLSKAMINSIASKKKPEFSAWAAWTLRF